MDRIKRNVTLAWILALCGIAAFVPGSGASAEDQGGLKKVALSLEKALPALVAARDYRSASNTAFLLATARNRLAQTTGACAALAQSLEYYRKAVTKESGITEERASDLNEQTDGMADVRAKFGCTRA
jgi:hypothetical protein